MQEANVGEIVVNVRKIIFLIVQGLL
ncbi:uncharacterized protein METZ01_LOCUS40821 [marine metagenome]|uniref:Uncharacterized protein n=1 Tax=marine metagenome TaxID=408172 RepID=A0A381RDN1_9ZZZZ